MPLGSTGLNIMHWGIISPLLKPLLNINQAPYLQYLDRSFLDSHERVGKVELNL